MAEVQRYVFRYLDRGLEYWQRQVADYEARWSRSYGSTPEEAHRRHLENFAGTYEKEGGGYTRDLSEAKLIGWKSKRFIERGRDDGELIPAKIVIE